MGGTDAARSPSAFWRVDLHTHTRFSSDSLTEPAALIARARRVGLDRVAVTDHNTIEGARAARQLAPDLIIVGQEIDTAAGGELIAYFLQERVPPGLSLDETIRRLRAQGAVISISHPLDRLRGSALGETHTLEIIDQVDALEVFNARCLLATDNAHAAALAARHGKAITAGSDAHTLAELGHAYLSLPPFEDRPDAFLASLAQAQASGRLSGIWPHCCSTFAKLRKRL
ncbi:MAG: phosphotransferase [Chloroflexi bacterium HGW-Chloroflexi-1]|nr:MAG: phosphotransferase [Chloroflexi bacterium HGW-Chloroflexi-1]